MCFSQVKSKVMYILFWILFHYRLIDIEFPVLYSRSLFTYFIYSSMYIGEGDGNPLQYSCLENPVDRGAWWADVHRVTQSRAQLKRLSSSSVYMLIPNS